MILAGATLPAYAAAQDGAGQVPGEAPATDETLVVTGLEAEGALTGVDTDEMIFLVVGDDGAEMMFYYEAQTSVAGQDDGVQGLAGDAGTRVRIEYRAEGTRAIAESIEILAAAPAETESEIAPGPEPTLPAPGL
jgi:hypothetical protein